MFNTAEFSGILSLFRQAGTTGLGRRGQVLAEGKEEIGETLLKCPPASKMTTVTAEHHWEETQLWQLNCRECPQCGSPHLLICCVLNEGAVSSCTFAIHCASSCVYAGAGVWRQETKLLWKSHPAPKRSPVKGPLLGTYHCIFYFCRPQPVSTDVNDIIHAPCYLVIAFLAPVSTIPCEVVTCSKDTGLISSSKCASFGLWGRTDHAIGWQVWQGGSGSLQAFASSRLCDLPHTISHFPLPSLALLCSTWVVLAPNKHLNSTKAVELRSLPRWTNHCRQSAATSGWRSYSKIKPSNTTQWCSVGFTEPRGAFWFPGFACLHLHSSCVLRPLGAHSIKAKPLQMPFAIMPQATGQAKNCCWLHLSMHWKTTTVQLKGSSSITFCTWEHCQFFNHLR